MAGTYGTGCPSTQGTDVLVRKERTWPIGSGGLTASEVDKHWEMQRRVDMNDPGKW